MNPAENGRPWLAISSASTPPRLPAPGRVPYSGVWLSRYEYFSSGRGASFADRHFVVVLQHGDRLTVRSLPGSSDSSLAMDLTVDGVDRFSRVRRRHTEIRVGPNGSVRHLVMDIRTPSEPEPQHRDLKDPFYN